MTIDDLKFPSSWPEGQKFNMILREDLTLPDKRVICEGEFITLMHDGIHAIIEHDAKILKY